jgi:hypothetical protein
VRQRAPRRKHESRISHFGDPHRPEIAMALFVTLGPRGSNHELVARRYLDFHGLGDAELRLVEDFHEGLGMLARDRADYLIQAAAHWQTASTLAEGFFKHGIRAIDCFIAPSHPLAILTRTEVKAPRAIGLQPATARYADLSAWPVKVEEPTTVAVGEGLLAGRYDSGITMRRLAEEHPDTLRVDLDLGSVDDPWIVYGRTQVRSDDILAWPDSPAGRLYRGA